MLWLQGGHDDGQADSFRAFRGVGFRSRLDGAGGGKLSRRLPVRSVNRTITATNDATYSAACGTGGTGQATAHAEISLLEVSASTGGSATPAQSLAPARYTDQVTLPPGEQYAIVSLLLNGSITQTSGTGSLMLTLKAGSTSSQLRFSAPAGQTTTITNQVFTAGPIFVTGKSFRYTAEIDASARGGTASSQLTTGLFGTASRALPRVYRDGTDSEGPTNFQTGALPRRPVRQNQAGSPLDSAGAYC
jgi:hypothetical protein